MSVHSFCLIIARFEYLSIYHLPSDPAMVEKITKSLSLTVSPHILRSKDPRALLTAVFSAWLPLSTAVLVSVIEYLPNPKVAQANRLPTIIGASPGSGHVDLAVKNAMTYFKASEEDPVVAYVSKMVSVPFKELPQNKRKTGGIMSGEEARELARRKRAELVKVMSALDQESSNDLSGVSQALETTSVSEAGEESGGAEAAEQEPEQLVGFARIYSGNLNVGDAIYVLPPKFSPASPHSVPEPKKVLVTGLYLLMGRGLEALSSVPAGVVCGIGGLEGHILKTGTLCSQLEGSVNLAGVGLGSQPIVRVALEPVNPGDLEKLVTGMRLLEQSDPSARYEVLDSGEHVILTAGELHLERCLKDLRERFARCEIQVGEPIVPYRESIVDAAEMAPPRDKDLPRGTIEAATTSKQVTIVLRCRPLPPQVTEYLDRNAGAIRRLYGERKSLELASKSNGIEEIPDHEAAEETMVENTNLLSLKDFQHGLQSVFVESKGQSELWHNIVNKIVAFGPRRVGPNLLIDNTKQEVCERL